MEIIKMSLIFIRIHDDITFVILFRYFGFVKGGFHFLIENNLMKFSFSHQIYYFNFYFELDVQIWNEKCEGKVIYSSITPIMRYFYSSRILLIHRTSRSLKLKKRSGDEWFWIVRILYHFASKAAATLCNTPQFHTNTWFEWGRYFPTFSFGAWTY